MQVYEGAKMSIRSIKMRSGEGRGKNVFCKVTWKGFLALRDVSGQKQQYLHINIYAYN